MKKKIIAFVVVALVLCLSLLSLASCRTLTPEEGFAALKAAYEYSIKIDEAGGIYNGEVYYYKEQDRRAIEMVYNPSTGKYVPVSLKNTTVNLHCYVDDDYNFHPDQDYGVYVLEDKYIQARNSMGNMADKYNSNVVYNAQGSTVTYSEDFPLAGKDANNYDLSSAQYYGVNATLNPDKDAPVTDRFLAASTGKVFGFNVTTWKVGHAFAKLKIREIHGIFGGELAGHYYFRDFGNCDSGVLASLIVLSVVADLKREGRTLGSFIDEIVTYANSGEVNFRLEDKDGAIEALCSRFIDHDSPDKILDFDGRRIEFPTWWFNVRKSNTEPYLRIVCEARDGVELKKRLDEISSIIHKFD